MGNSDEENYFFIEGALHWLMVFILVCILCAWAFVIYG
jgi:cytochrome b561